MAAVEAYGMVTYHSLPGMVTYACNFSSLEAKATELQGEG